MLANGRLIASGTRQKLTKKKQLPEGRFLYCCYTSGNRVRNTFNASNLGNSNPLFEPRSIEGRYYDT
jgi:hypothetical protein